MNKKVSFLLLSSVFLLAMSSCGGSSSPEVEYIPVQTTEDGSWRFIDSKGKFVGNQEWEFQPTVTIDGIFVTMGDSGYNVYKWDGDKAVGIDSLQNLVSVGIYNEGLLPVTPSMQRIRIVDKNGNVKFILDPIEGQEVSSCSGMVSDGMLIVSNMDYKKGAVNNKGEVVYQFKYNEISDFKDGYALAAIYEENSNGPTYYVLDKKGNEIKVNGEFSFPEGECNDISSFSNGKATVMGPYPVDGGNWEQLEINNLGEVNKVASNSEEGVYTSRDVLDNGDVIVNTYGDAQNKSEWLNAKGEVIKKTSGNEGSFNSYGKFVTTSTNESITIYSEDGKEIYKANGNYWGSWPGGKFGMVLQKMGENYNSEGYILLDSKGKVLETPKIYGVGSSKDAEELHGDEIYCGSWVSSAYVDVTAAAAKIVSMITNGVTGKSSYYIGESVKTILDGESTQYLSGKEFSIPTPDNSYNLATGAGFYINGDIIANANVVAPTFKEYFDVAYYDRRGTAWGWKRKKQVGTHVNAAAKVAAFDIRLHTNHPSGKSLKEAIGRRLKKDGYTLLDSADNYEVYSNNYREAIIYGSNDSKGIGVIIGDAGKLKYTSAEKTALATRI